MLTILGGHVPLSLDFLFVIGSRDDCDLVFGGLSLGCPRGRKDAEPMQQMGPVAGVSLMPPLLTSGGWESRICHSVWAEHIS